MDLDRAYTERADAHSGTIGTRSWMQTGRQKKDRQKEVQAKAMRAGQRAENTQDRRARSNCLGGLRQEDTSMDA